MKPIIFAVTVWFASLAATSINVHAEDTQLLWGDTHLHTSYVRHQRLWDRLG